MSIVNKWDNKHLCYMCSLQIAAQISLFSLGRRVCDRCGSYQITYKVLKYTRKDCEKKDKTYSEDNSSTKQNDS